MKTLLFQLLLSLYATLVFAHPHDDQPLRPKPFCEALGATKKESLATLTKMVLAQDWREASTAVDVLISEKNFDELTAAEIKSAVVFDTREGEEKKYYNIPGYAMFVERLHLLLIKKTLETSSLMFQFVEWIDYCNYIIPRWDEAIAKNKNSELRNEVFSKLKFEIEELELGDSTTLTREFGKKAALKSNIAVKIHHPEFSDILLNSLKRGQIGQYLAQWDILLLEFALPEEREGVARAVHFVRYKPARKEGWIYYDKREGNRINPQDAWYYTVAAKTRRLTEYEHPKPYIGYGVHEKEIWEKIVAVSP